MDKIAYEWADGKHPQYSYLFRINFKRLHTYQSEVGSAPRKLIKFIQLEIVNSIDIVGKHYFDKTFINELEK